MRVSHFIDFTRPRGSRQRGKIQHHPGRMAAQAVVVDRVRSGHGDDHSATARESDAGHMRRRAMNATDCASPVGPGGFRTGVPTVGRVGIKRTRRRNSPRHSREPVVTGLRVRIRFTRPTWFCSPHRFASLSEVRGMPAAESAEDIIAWRPALYFLNDRGFANMHCVRCGCDRYADPMVPRRRPAPSPTVLRVPGSPCARISVCQNLQGRPNREAVARDRTVKLSGSPDPVTAACRVTREPPLNPRWRNLR